jgi:1,4-alpha-glucan branching enzyme
MRQSPPTEMPGYVSLLLHAHLPFVRHPEHDRFLEESWLFEAITETYLPLLATFRAWKRDGVRAQLTLTLSPTLCAMLQDDLLRHRYERHLQTLVELATRETFRTQWEPGFRDLSGFYHLRFEDLLTLWHTCGGDLVTAFRELQDAGLIEIATCAATHGLLPLLASHPSSLRGQLLTARDDYRRCFGRDPAGIWLPECAYTPALDPFLKEAGLHWFVVDTHGLLHAQPRPRYGVFAPVITPSGLAAFGRDLDSARQVWSRDAGYPGDPRYRDFYRDIGFDLEFEYVRPALPSPERRGFTGIKYHRIATGPQGEKEPYRREDACAAAADHARHFLAARVSQAESLGAVLGKPAMVVCPYDAELFGHWWYEGPEFLDTFVRGAALAPSSLRLVSPSSYLEENPTHQAASPAESSWGEEGYYRVWLNETNEWIVPHLDTAMARMHDLAQRTTREDPLTQRALRQAARELLLAQASDWPFIMRTGTSPAYARQRVTDHLLRFIDLHEQLTTTRVDETRLRQIESIDPVFPNIDPRHWS